MLLNELVKTPWYQDHLEIIMRSAKRHEDKVKKVVELLASSKFREAAKAAEGELLGGDIYKDQRPGSLHAWMAEACAFAYTVAEFSHG